MDSTPPTLTAVPDPPDIAPAPRKAPLDPAGMGTALVTALMNAAQQFAFGKPRGFHCYAFIHEDALGGVAEVQDAIDEVNASGEYHVAVSSGERDRIIQLCQTGHNHPPVMIAAQG